eukprot:jgi/Psemu1/288588/fgenesh1_pg.273_\
MAKCEFGGAVAPPSTVTTTDHIPVRTGTVSMSFSFASSVVGLCLLWSSASVEALSSTSSPKPSLDPSKIRAISLDVTGTLLATKEPVVKSYRDAAIWAKLPDIPSEQDFKAGFKEAFRSRSIESPCFGGVEGISGRDWWLETVRQVLHCALLEAKKDDYYEFHYNEEEFQRYFRRVYQHFGSPAGYMVLEDAQLFLASIEQHLQHDNNNNLVLGITSNTPIRHMESVLPMLDCLHDRFSWFTCSQEVGHEKPSPQIFEDAYEKAKFWLEDPNLEKDAVLHIGDSYTNDYCGAKAFGFQALLLDRSDNPNVTTYQDWLEAPDYPGKSLEDVEKNTIKSLEEVASLVAL